MTTAELVTIFLENYDELSACAVMLTGRTQDAEDLLSVLLIKIYTQEKFLKVKNPLPYFKSCLKNESTSIKKRNGRVRFFEEEEAEAIGYTQEDFEEVLSSRETRELLNKTFEKFSPELIEAFVKFHLEGYSAMEIAEELGMNVNTLSQHLSRMRRKLRDRAPYLWNMIMLVFLSRGGI
ncbi:MAG: sigma-70 family RNA polymerase sigma factor [Clostridia bacterium]|nr:sigma-70 family RNA polymerase sigma factor [Clostridia bacterium]